MNQGAQVSRLSPDIQPGEEITAAWLNESRRAGKANSDGTELRRASGGRENYDLDFPPAYTKARLVCTDDITSGLRVIDGKQINDGDLILVATGGAPAADGLYRARSGSWEWIVRLSFDQGFFGSDGTLVYPHGTLISIWDGTSGPFLWRAAVDSFGATF